MAYFVAGVLVLLGLAGVGAIWQALAGRRDRHRFPPPGRLVDVGGHRLHLTVTGRPTGAPTVVLEAGMASMSANWAWVRADLGRDGRVVAYDRAGLGWSDDGTGAMDAATSAADLHAALGAAGVAPRRAVVHRRPAGPGVRRDARVPGRAAGLVGRGRRAARLGPVLPRPGQRGRWPRRPAAGGAQRHRAGPVRRTARPAPGPTAGAVVQQPARDRRRATHYTLVSERRHAEVVSAAIRAVLAAARSGGALADFGPA